MDIKNGLVRGFLKVVGGLWATRIDTQELTAERIEGKEINEIKSGISGLQATAAQLNSQLTNISAGNILVGKAQSSNVTSFLLETDNRSDNDTPEIYMKKGKGVCLEFKTKNTIGLNNISQSYVSLAVFVPWTDPSGGYPVRIAICSEGLWYQSGTNKTSWGVWTKL